MMEHSYGVRRKESTCCDHRYVIAFLLSIGLFISSNIQDYFSNALLFPDTYRNMSSNDDWEGFIAGGAVSHQIATFISVGFAATATLKYDSKKMLAIGIAGSSVTNLLIPAIVPLGTALVIFLSIVKGVFEGIVFPFVIIVVSYCVPVEENSILVAIVLIGYILGESLNTTIFSTIAFSHASHFGIPFYVFGAVGICWAVLWFFVKSGKKRSEAGVHATSSSELQQIVGEEIVGEITTVI